MNATHNSAKWRGRMAGSIVESIYSGPINQSAFLALRDQAIEALAGSTGLVVRLDTSLLFCDLDVDLSKYAPGACAGAVVCNEEQWERAIAHARQMTIGGVRRTVWREYQLAQAYEWAYRNATPRPSLR